MPNGNEIIGNKLEEIRSLLDIERQDELDTSSIEYAWYVGATGTDASGKYFDNAELFISEGRWENGWDNRFTEEVCSMKVGDHIALKSTSKQKFNLPFNSNGNWVGFADIKAIGVITENSGDGKNIKVDWQKFDSPKRWYSFMGFIRDTIDLVKAEDGFAKKALLDFTFNNAKQDYSLCEEHYQTDKLEDELDGKEFDEKDASPKSLQNCLEIKRSPRINKLFPLNLIVYGAPGTGKTYSMVEYALAIANNVPLEEFKNNHPDRKTNIASYKELVKDKQIVFTTFHQNYGYEEFIQGLRPDTDSKTMAFKTVDGIFKRIADRALNDTENKNFVIIIDEINRANISKVFGELITLIEEDKRWGELNETCVTLQSGEPFAVPNNLYIIGTMNSADKSISLIDAALRRRFDFVEQKPDSSLVKNSVLKAMLENINLGLVEKLDSTDLLVGHSYFMGREEKDLCSILNNNIIPLLYEYFYDDRKKVSALLKNAIIKSNTNIEIVDEKVGRLYVKENS